MRRGGREARLHGGYELLSVPDIVYRGPQSWTFFFFPSVFTHYKNSKSCNVGCVINACSFSLQIYVLIMAQIRRLSLHQNVNERDNTFPAAHSFKAGLFSKGF